MKLYRECLRCINLAKSSNPSEQLESLLIQMTDKVQGEETAIDLESKKISLNLSYPSNEKIPFIANCLELRTNEEFGRHIVTTRDLKVGDVVIMERPFVAGFKNKSQQYKRCAHCMTGEMRHVGIPCPKCTCAMYCSEGCLTSAWDAYHRFECPITKNLATCKDPLQGIALRSLLTGVSVFGGVRAFQEYLEEHRNTNITPFDLDHTKPDHKFQFLALHNLQSEGPKIIRQIEVAEQIHFLVAKNVFDEDIDKNLECFLLTTLYRYRMIVSLNCFGTNNCFPPKHIFKPSYSSLQLVLSMISHSCIDLCRTTSR